MDIRTACASVRHPIAFAMVLAVAACFFVLGFTRVPAFADDAAGQDQASSQGQLVAAASDGLLQAQASVSESGLGVIVRAKDNPSAARFVKALRLEGDSASTIALPSFVDLASVELCYGNDVDSASPAFVSASKDGAYAQGAVNAKSLPKDSRGAYCAYAKNGEGGSPESVRIVWSANVGTVFLTSADPVNQGRGFIEASRDHSAETTGSMLMTDASGSAVYDGALTQIKGRGNATWDAAKKPYQIKLDKKTALLGGGSANKAKTWVLLANAYDETGGLRNYVALRTALALGQSNAPECDFVDLYYDGEYRGLYLLSEKVQVNSGRVEIDEIENVSNDGIDLEKHRTRRTTNKYGYAFQFIEGAQLSAESKGDNTGGYLLEVNVGRFSDERSWFMSSIGAIEIKSPENASYEQVKYVSERFQAMLGVLGKPDGDAASVIDLTSLAQTHLANEFGKNFDYLAYSTFFYLPKDSQVFYAGPVWDFDLSFGVFPYRSDGGEYVDARGYASQSRNFFSQNKAAVAAVKSLFVEKALATMRGWTVGDATLQNTWQRIATAASMNDLIWGSAHYSVGTYVMFNDTSKAVDYLVTWITERVAWFSEAIPSAETFTSVDYSGIGERAAQSAAAGETGVIRLWGQVALDTMAAILDRGQFETESMAILVTNESFHDALTASGVAGMVNAPIIMTDPSGLSPQAQTQLEKLKPKKIIVCGGEGALPLHVANAAAEAAGGAEVERLWGNVASETAVAIFNQGAQATGGSWSRTAFVCTASGYWDALAASPISYATGMPIFLADGNGTYLSDATMNALKESVSAVYIVGGEAAVSPSVREQLKDAGIPVAGILWGDTAVDTSREVASFGLAKGMNAANVGVATNDGYWDALAAAPFCGRMNAVMVLAGGPGDSSITGFLHDLGDATKSAYVFGGEAAVSNATYQAIRAAIGS